MEKFLEKFQYEIEKKMLACIKGESIVKPFSQIYSEVRDKVVQKKNTKKRIGIYSDEEASIYETVVQEFLKEHPELLEKKEKKE